MYSIIGWCSHQIICLKVMRKQVAIEWAFKLSMPVREWTMSFQLKIFKGVQTNSSKKNKKLLLRNASYIVY
jgi:hypothetical protein